MSEIELKACPFCGGSAFMVQEGTHAQCLTPGCCVGPVRGLDSWNTRAPQWQPIESAPKGQEVLVWRPDQGVFIAMIATPDMVMSEREIEECCLPEDFEEWYCEAWGWLEDDLRPTRWMPKPAEPEVDG
ncbi:TPA: hypothetical protein ACXNG6_000195 [Stenotrophomonas maltophilia]